MIPDFAFRDASGRTWRITLTCASVVRCEEKTGVKLLNLIDRAEVERVPATDRWEAMAFILAEDMRAAGVTSEELQSAIRTKGEEDAAWSALRVAIIRFLPDLPDKPQKAGPTSGTFHDTIVRWIFDSAAWCGVEPWGYTLRTLDMQASKAARIAGRSVNAGRGGKTPATGPKSLRDIPREHLARMFRKG